MITPGFHRATLGVIVPFDARYVVLPSAFERDLRSRAGSVVLLDDAARDHEHLGRNFGPREPPQPAQRRFARRRRRIRRLQWRAGRLQDIARRDPLGSRAGEKLRRARGRHPT